MAARSGGGGTTFTGSLIASTNLYRALLAVLNANMTLSQSTNLYRVATAKLVAAMNAIAVFDPLVLWYTFDSAKISGTNILDSSVDAITGTTTTVTTAAPVMGDQALAFSAAASNAITSNAGVTRLSLSGSSRTITFWVKDVPADGGTYCLVDNGGVLDSGTGMMVFISGGFLRANGISSAITPGTEIDGIANDDLGITSGAWIHIAAVFDATDPNNVFLYKNAVSQGISLVNNAAGQPLDANISATVIGSRTGGAWKLTGKLDDVRFFQGALSAAQIAVIYSQFAPVLQATAFLIANATMKMVVTGTLPAQAFLIASAQIYKPTTATLGASANLIANVIRYTPTTAVLPAEMFLTASMVQQMAASSKLVAQAFLTADSAMYRPLVSTLPAEAFLIAKLDRYSPVTATLAAEAFLVASASIALTAKASLNSEAFMIADAVRFTPTTAVLQAEVDMIASAVLNLAASAVLSSEAFMIAQIDRYSPIEANLPAEAFLTASATLLLSTSATLAGEAFMIASADRYAPVQAALAAEVNLLANMTVWMRAAATMAAEAFIIAIATIQPGPGPGGAAGGGGPFLKNVGRLMNRRGG